MHAHTSRPDPGPTLREAAPAKINLALHVVGRRDDGYHLLDTLVTFAETGDVLTAEAAGTLSLSVDGPFAAGLSAGDDNLVLAAARALRDHPAAAGRAVGARLHLTKSLPVASGIGGGSADAAAALRVLNRLWGLALDTAELEAIGEGLGADVPMCVAGRPARATGIGTELQAVGELPGLDAVLVNPGVGVSTPSIFKALTRRDNAPIAALPARFDDRRAFLDFIAACRNDLEAAAIARQPVIADARDALMTLDGCRFARMSGSGATCFGLFDSPAAAEAAATALRDARPGWWVAATRL